MPVLKRAGRLTIALGLAAGLATAWTVSVTEVAAQIEDSRPVPLANPAIDNSCGVGTTLVLDASGSVQSAGAVDDVRDAADAFLEALRNTTSTARVAQFGTVSEELAPSTLVDDASLADGGVQKLEKLERPQLVLENGEPAYLFCAAAPAGRLEQSFNVQIPLKQNVGP